MVAREFALKSMGRFVLECESVLAESSDISAHNAPKNSDKNAIFFINAPKILDLRIMR